MAFKRKRSTCELSSPISDTSSISMTSSDAPLPFFFQQHKAVEAPFSKPTWSWPTYQDDEPRGLNGRTRKRHRDNRPEEHAVHGMFLWLDCRSRSMPQLLIVFCCSKHNEQTIQCATITPECVADPVARNTSKA